MFFRRVFSKKNEAQQYQVQSPVVPGGRFTDGKPPTYPAPRRTASDENKRWLSVLQLTPLWEHIIRTRRLPDDLNMTEMIGEFQERLQDPEWQVRQHALRVLVDVLIVSGANVDHQFGPLVEPLVENLGHSAPSVRKGSLDALRVLLTETSKPDEIINEILVVGMDDTAVDNPQKSRITAGVMLSLPSLVHTTIHTAKRNIILRSVIDALLNKMVQLQFQEVALKVLLRLKDMLGSTEFYDYFSFTARRDFDLLCNVYGMSNSSNFRDSGIDLHLPSSTESKNSWRHTTPPKTVITDVNGNSKRSSANICKQPVQKQQSLDRSSAWKNDSHSASDTDNRISGEEQPPKKNDFSGKCTSGGGKEQGLGCTSSEKVIMETEIDFGGDTSVTMRILEAQPSHDITITDESEDEHALGVLRVLTDSEIEEINSNADPDPEMGRRTPRRVRFGGEMVKLRTPDSDTVTQSDVDEINIHPVTLPVTPQSSGRSTPVQQHLSIDIPSDSTRPLPESPTTTATTTPPSSIQHTATSDSHPSNDSIEPLQQSSAVAPLRRRRSVSLTQDVIASPGTLHKEIEVLHNLQRSPSISPTRARHNSANAVFNRSESKIDAQERALVIATPNAFHEANRPPQAFASPSEDSSSTQHEDSPVVESSPSPSWEHLDIVDAETISDLQSPDWRHRLQGVAQLSESLKLSDNLALVQPCLQSLLRTLLSSEKHSEVAEDKRRILVNLFSRLPLDNLEDRVVQILIGLCRQGGAAANRSAKALMQRLPPAAIVLRLLSDEFLHSRSSRFRENALQMVLYALMTFPSTYFDISTCVVRATHAAIDRKKRVRQAALDVLAVLGQISSPRVVMDGVAKIADHQQDGDHFNAAVKARLSRKQLPMVSADGTIQYALRIPSPDSSTPTYLFGADVEWIVAGIGSVSPTSLKKRTQQSVGVADRNSVYPLNKGSQRSRPFHEILSIGGGVQPNIYDQHVGNLSMWTKRNEFSMDIERNTQYIVATAIPTQMATIPSSAIRPLSNMKLQSRSFPELSDVGATSGHKMVRLQNADNRTTTTTTTTATTATTATAISTEMATTTTMAAASNAGISTLSQHMAENYIRPSRLPVTSRFPAMGQRFTVSNNVPLDTMLGKNNPYEMRGVRLNASLPRNMHSSKFSAVSSGFNSDPHESPPVRIKPAETRPMTHPALELSAHKPRRFVHLDSSLVADNVQRSYPPKTATSNKRSSSPSDTHAPLASASTNVSPSSSPGGQQRSIDTHNHRSSSENNSPTLSTHTRILGRQENNPYSARVAVSSVGPEETDDNEEEDDIDDVVVLPQNASRSQTVSRSHSTASILSTVQGDEKTTPGSSGRPKTASSGRTTRPASCEDLSERSKTPGDHKIHENDEVISCDSLDGNDIKDIAPHSKSVMSSELSAQSTEDMENVLPHTHTRSVFRKPRPPPLLRGAGRKPSPLKVQKSNEHVPVTLDRRSTDLPKDAVSTCLSQMDNPTWEVTITGLQTFVRLIRHHPEAVDSQIHVLAVALAKQVKNLRSQVARTACQACTEFFTTHRRTVESEADDLASCLLNRTADTNKFLRADATAALESMCDNLHASKLIQILSTRGASHPNAVVRTTTAKLFARLVARLGMDKVFSMQKECRDRLIMTNANLLMEGSLETRNNAKLVFKQIVGHPSYAKLLLDVIPQKTYRNIEKTLKSIR